MPPQRLPIAAAGLVLGMISLAAILGACLPARTAFLLTISVYWLACWTLILRIRSDTSPPQPLTSPRNEAWVNGMIWIPSIAVACIALTRSTGLPSTRGIALVFVMALINGTTEECFWRHSFAKWFTDRPRGLFLPCLLFTAWHLALLLIPNVRYEGGGWVLIAGAGAMGCTWAYAYWFQRNLVSICAAHATTNIFAFHILVTDNGWIATG